MIHFEHRRFGNGLEVYVLPDPHTPTVVTNLLYDVGSKDEDEQATGFAHFFEHLMFSGTPREPEFDIPVHMVGGSNNAFTSTDLTNYYIQVPAENLEMALYLEADRMETLAFDERGFQVQQRVVCEEFKERYLNQPYGDLWLNLRPLIWDSSPYRWPTIGKKLQHIEDFTLDSVKSFFRRYYNPGNAVLVIAGGVNPSRAFDLADKYFGSLGNAEAIPARNWPVESPLEAIRHQSLERDVPSRALYMAWRIPGHRDKAYPAFDLLTDVLAQGDASRLKSRLLYGTELFSSLDAYVTGELEAGLLVIGGKLQPGVELDAAREAIRNELDSLSAEGIGDAELQRALALFKTQYHKMDVSTTGKAFALAYSHLLGNPDLLNNYPKIYEQVRAEDIEQALRRDILNSPYAELSYQPKNLNT